MEVSEAKSKIRTFFLALVLSPDSQTLRDAIRNKLIKELPDLGPIDLDVATEYFLARESKTGMPKAKENLLKRIGYLYQAAFRTPRGSKERMEIFRELLSFERIIRGNILVSEVKTAVNYKMINTPWAGSKAVSMDELYNRTIETDPDKLPEEVKYILKSLELEQGKSYWQFVKHEVGGIVFIPYLEKTIKSLHQEDQGTAEELTRTVFIDPLGEIFNSPSPAWAIAARIVHEAAHINWYHKRGDDLSLATWLPNERNATVATYNFLNKLLSNPKIHFNKEEREVIFSRIELKKLNIRDHNRRLGCQENDFSIHK